MAKTAVTLIVWLCIALSAVAAQPPKPAAKTVRPAWSELTPSQQQVLAPLATEWGEMGSTRRKKWVAIANRYPKMKPAEQQRLQKRMKDWAALAPEQRKKARERYKGMTPEQRREMRKQWQAYRRSLAQPETPFDPPVAEPITEPTPPPATSTQTQ